MTMHLTLGELRSRIVEAIGDRNLPYDKTHLICWVLARAGRPMSRQDVMRRVEAVENKDPAAFKSTTNNDYWAPSPVMRGGWEPDPDNQGAFREVEPRMVPNTANRARYSIMRRGFVKVAGKKGNQLLYTLTPAGQELADEADEFLKDDIDPSEFETLARF